ncbi:uncharacterized protein LOC130111843 [Lampris incognitus]|uniref:uncharacterized protein LOC130111843 n=1 Tax=Lampris incognitus TaxID=2546036 RepID=UPI0024B62367|nr:uncharacterized protein LOC130111843 [Lampris incognitus]XP_056135115.1 uncharacterized protein LOC130111843 [Lampris incognitus]XP_056135116.1 uncharacterized protein LOC130111843 [Lampris incognitus]
MSTSEDVGEGSNETDPVVREEESGWDRARGIRDREHVDALLDISDEEQEPYDDQCLSAWDVAAQGWGRVAPLAGIFLPQRKARKPRNEDPDYHCLLCVDIRPPDRDSSAKCPEYRCKPLMSLQGRGLNKTMPSNLPTILHSQPPGPAPVNEAPECSVLRAPQNTTQHHPLREKMVEGKLRESVHLSPPFQSHYLDSKYTTLKSSPSNILLSVNSCAALPPVKSSELKFQVVTDQFCGGQAASGHSIAGRESSETDSVISTREGGGAERREETRVDPVANSVLPKDSCGATLTSKYCSKYCTCQQTRHLLSTLNVPRRYEVPLTPTADTVSRSNLFMDRHLKRSLQTSCVYSRHSRLTTPQLPVLSVTKVPLSISAQRLL